MFCYCLGRAAAQPQSTAAAPALLGQSDVGLRLPERLAPAVFGGAAFLELELELGLKLGRTDAGSASRAPPRLVLSSSSAQSRRLA